MNGSTKTGPGNHLYFNLLAEKHLELLFTVLAFFCFGPGNYSGCLHAAGALEKTAYFYGKDENGWRKRCVKGVLNGLFRENKKRKRIHITWK